MGRTVLDVDVIHQRSRVGRRAWPQNPSDHGEIVFGGFEGYGQEAQTIRPGVVHGNFGGSPRPA
jgi:hypothetical protein